MSAMLLCRIGRLIKSYFLKLTEIRKGIFRLIQRALSDVRAVNPKQRVTNGSENNMKIKLNVAVNHYSAPGIINTHCYQNVDP
jgi:hypothetical protein